MTTTPAALPLNLHGPPKVITVTNLKGGTGKTTTAAHVAHALHERGFSVLAMDADPQGSLMTWHEAAEFPFPCVGLPSTKLHREIPGVAGDRFSHVVIDSPPTEYAAARNIVLSALRAATEVLCPIAPTPAEYERLRAMSAVLDDVAAQRPDGRPPRVGVLLVRTVAAAASTDVYRRTMAADGWRVLAAHVPRREAYAQSFGEPVVRARASGYGDAVAELLGLPLAPSPHARSLREVMA